MDLDGTSGSQGLILYDYWRSSACYRVRIALNLKKIAYQAVAINLVKNGGDQHGEDYRALNPQGLIPALVHDGEVITQSFAICEYLDSVYPDTPLFPSNALQRSAAVSMAMTIACDIHPLNNLRVQKYLKGKLGAGDEQAVTWMNHWVSQGFSALETRLGESSTGDAFSFGDRPGIVECFLLPQVYNAERFECDMVPFPLIREISARCRQLKAFQDADPSAQPDAPEQ
jgi:maleylacetoacetate isomerase